MLFLLNYNHQLLSLVLISKKYDLNIDVMNFKTKNRSQDPNKTFTPDSNIETVAEFLESATELDPNIERTGDKTIFNDDALCKKFLKDIKYDEIIAECEAKNLPEKDRFHYLEKHLKSTIFIILATFLTLALLKNR